jgi:predicted AlkP superfamily phosphohydrolase/phosphomutase
MESRPFQNTPSLEGRGASMSKRVIVLGIDGASPGLLLPWVERGQLPSLGRVLQRGAHGPLRSTIPPYSAQAWVSMMTGRQPSKHGVVDFFEREAGRPQHAFISSSLIEGEAIWDVLGRYGKRVGMVNVPLTYPPLPVNGYMVSGFMTPKGRSDYTYPPDLLAEILGVTGKYDPDPWDLIHPGQDLASFSSWMGITEQAATYLHAKYPVDLYVSVIQALDHLQHHFWDLLVDEEARNTAEGTRTWPTLQSCFAAMDEAVGQRLEWLDGDTTLFLASDHGFQAVDTWFHVNRWLSEQGFLAFTKAGGGAVKSALSRVGWSRENLKRWVRRLDPLGLRRLLGRFTRASIADKLDDAMAVPIDWSQTVAYSGSRTSEGIYINLQGREPHGVVEPGEQYEQVCSRIMAGLASLVDPSTGEPVVSELYRREELYSGPYLEQMPDILLVFDDRPYLVNESTAGRDVFTPIDKSSVTGRHHSQGLFAAVGPDIVRGAAVRANIVDVAPTILYALGLPIPAGMDGVVLQDIFSQDFRQAHPLRYEELQASSTRTAEQAPAYSEEEEEEMQRRLRALGYTD